MQAGSKVYALGADYLVQGCCAHMGAESNELSYGIDILNTNFDVNDTTTFTIASCSFYNNSVHVWQPTFSS